MRLKKFGGNNLYEKEIVWEIKMQNETLIVKIQ